MLHFEQTLPLFLAQGSSCPGSAGEAAPVPHTSPDPRRFRPAPSGLRDGGRPGPAAAGTPRVRTAATRGAVAATAPGRPVGAAPHPRQCLRIPSTLPPPPPRHRCLCRLLLLLKKRFRGRCMVLGRQGRVHPSARPRRGVTAPPAPADPSASPGPRCRRKPSQVTKSNLKPRTINEDFLPFVAPRASWH